MNTENKIVAGAAIVGLLVGFGIGYLMWGTQGNVNAVQGGEENTENQAAVIPSISAPADFVEIADQAAGKSVVLTKGKVSAVSWIAVHEDKAGEIGNVLGARRFAAGDVGALPIPLLRGTVKGQKYHVGIYKDNGDLKFDRKTDTLLRKEDGEMVGMTFSAQ